MKKLILATIILLFACSKKETTPEPQPEPAPVPGLKEQTVYLEFIPTSNHYRLQLDVDWNGDEVKDTIVVWEKKPAPPYTSVTNNFIITKRVKAKIFKAYWYITEIA